MLQTAVFKLENSSAVYQALHRAKQGKGDCDRLIGAIVQQAGYQETVTFKRKLRGERGFRCSTADEPY